MSRLTILVDAYVTPKADATKRIPLRPLVFPGKVQISPILLLVNHLNTYLGVDDANRYHTGDTIISTRELCKPLQILGSLSSQRMYKYDKSQSYGRYHMYERP